MCWFVFSNPLFVQCFIVQIVYQVSASLHMSSIIVQHLQANTMLTCKAVKTILNVDVLGVRFSMSHVLTSHVLCGNFSISYVMCFWHFLCVHFSISYKFIFSMSYVFNLACLLFSFLHVSCVCFDVS